MTRCVVMVVAVILLLVAGLLVAAPAPKEDAAENLQGKWQIASFETGGLVAEKGDNVLHCEVEKNTIVFKDHGKVLSKGTFTLDPSKTPKAITITFTEGPKPEDKGKVLYGIYQVDKDTMKWCLTDGGEKDRPKEFTTGEGRKHELFTFKKEKP